MNTDTPRTDSHTKSKYRIIKIKSGKYFIQERFLWFWTTHHPIFRPTYMDSFYHAQLELEHIKRYKNAKREIVHEE